MTDKARDVDVLIIDDEPTVARALSRMLTLEGFNVETAQTAEEGLELISQKSCSMLICDQNMPEMMGTQLIQEAHDRGFNGKEILMTGMERTPEVEYAEKSGLEVFHKPWDTEQLKKRVRDVIGDPS